MANCGAKHTRHQVADEDWKCPRCGGVACPTGDVNEFIIQDPDAEADGNCALLHDADNLGCSCGYGTSGKAFAARVAKQKNLVKCPTCRGCGMVKA